MRNIEQVGCTNFKRLLKEVDGCRLARLRDVVVPNGARDFAHQYDRLLRDPGVFKAVFYRDPLERFLSGYLDKCGKGRVKVYCRTVFGSEETTFEEAVRVLRTLDPVGLDGHFHRQSDFCGGLKRYLPHFQYVAQLHPSTSRERVGRMLEVTNLTSRQFDALFPPNDGTRDDGHATDADAKLVEYYSKPEYVGAVVDYFFDDYVLFQIPLQPFAYEALLELNSTSSEYRLPQERLRTLVGITTQQSSLETKRDRELNSTSSEYKRPQERPRTLVDVATKQSSLETKRDRAAGGTYHSTSIRNSASLMYLGFLLSVCALCACLRPYTRRRTKLHDSKSS